MLRKTAIEGALERAKNRLGNDLPDKEVLLMTEKDKKDWHNWPDWDNDSEFPNWENQGGNPPK